MDTQTEFRSSWRDPGWIATLACAILALVPPLCMEWFLFHYAKARHGHPDDLTQLHQSAGIGLAGVIGELGCPVGLVLGLVACGIGLGGVVRARKRGGNTAVPGAAAAAGAFAALACAAAVLHGFSYWVQ